MAALEPAETADKFLNWYNKHDSKRLNPGGKNAAIRIRI
jgi:hypothetical protein